jgi:hypothetical protein
VPVRLYLSLSPFALAGGWGPLPFSRCAYRSHRHLHLFLGSFFYFPVRLCIFYLLFHTVPAYFFFSRSHAVHTMLLPSVYLLPAYLAATSTAYYIPSFPEFAPSIRQSHAQKPLRTAFDIWIDNEEKVSLDRLLANIKPGGRNVEGGDKGVVDGTVVASPSNDSPDYWYQCELPPIAST